MPKPIVTEHGPLSENLIAPLVITRWELQAGEEIPMHDHGLDPSSAHVTICASGSARFEFDGGAERIISAGELYEPLPEEQKHRVVAIASNTVIFNVVRG